MTNGARFPDGCNPGESLMNVRTGSRIDRRGFLAALPAIGAAAAGIPPRFAAAADAVAPPADLPQTDAATVQAFVGVAHGNVAEVRRMLERQPSLARASWDWGFGDWETALGAAAHTGGREIAGMLLAAGAPPTLFSAAMLGQLDVVKAIVAAAPGIQRMPGPHGLTLLHHARTGGEGSAAVVAFLEQLGGADERPRLVPLDAADRDAIVGRYAYGRDERDRFDVDVRNDQLGIQRPGTTRRNLMHTGALVFFPSGVPSVKIAFAKAGPRIARLTIADPDVNLTAEREP